MTHTITADDTIDEQTFLGMIRREVERAGSLRALGDEWGVSASFLSGVLNGKYRPNDSIAARFGLERVVTVAYTRRVATKAEASVGGDLLAALIDLTERAEVLAEETPEFDESPISPGLIANARAAISKAMAEVCGV